MVHGYTKWYCTVQNNPSENSGPGPVIAFLWGQTMVCVAYLKSCHPRARSINCHGT